MRAVPRHGMMSPPLPCPPRHIGSVRLGCNDSEVSLAVGSCLRHCDAGHAERVAHGAMSHAESANLTCPTGEGFAIRCEDGSVVVLAGGPLTAR